MPARFIVDNGAYTLRNQGDLAMLEVCVQQIRSHYPDAEIFVLAWDPILAESLFPGVKGLSAEARNQAYLAAEAKPWVALPDPPNAFLKVLAGTDAVVVAGGGFLNDLNPIQTRAVFRMLADAAARGTCTALFSQGLGPLRNPELLALLQHLAQTHTYFGVREEREGPEMLARLGVDPRRICVTGDDAIQLAWRARSRRPGTALGFSLRQAEYSEITPADLEEIGFAVTSLAALFRVPIVSLPISLNAHEDDPKTLALALGQSNPAALPQHPRDLISRAASCQVVVTGTYHGAVFALAQGIPCVGLYRSKYYRDKMLGLAAQFPGAIEPLNLAQSRAQPRIEAAAERLWRDAPRLRPGALRLAATQVRVGKKFYRRVLSSLPCAAGNTWLARWVPRRRSVLHAPEGIAAPLPGS